MDSQPSNNYPAAAAKPAEPLITPGLKILEESWKIFTKLWKKFLGLLVIIPIISSLIWVVLMVIIVLIYLLLGDHISPSAIGSIWMGLLTGNIWGNVLAIVLGAIAAISLVILVIVPFMVGFYSTIFILREPELKVWDAFKKGLKFFWRYLWLMIIVGVVTLVGYILLVVPGIIFSIWFTFVIYILLLENRGGFKALGRSRDLVRGFWWTVFARLLIIVIFSMTISLMLNILSSLGDPLVEFGIKLNQLALVMIGTILAIIIAIISLIANFIVYSLTIIYDYRLYEKIKAVKDQDGQAVDKMNTGKKFGLCLVLIVPFIIFILVGSLMAMVGVGSFIESQFGTSTVNINTTVPSSTGGAIFQADTSTIDLDSALPD